MINEHVNVWKVKDADGERGSPGSFLFPLYFSDKYCTAVQMWGHSPFQVTCTPVGMKLVANNMYVNPSMCFSRRYCLTKHIHRMFPWIAVKRLKKFWLEGKALVNFSPCHSETPVMWCSFSYLRRLIMTSLRWGNQCNDRSRVKFLKNRLKVIKRSSMTS